MNKLTKLLSVFVIAGAVGTGAAFASGCAHKHSYSDDWKDEGAAGHYHMAICEHNTEHTELEPHNDEKINETDSEGKDYKCDQCGYDMATHVESISLNVPNKTLEKGDTFKLTATVLPSDASIKDYTFSSSKTSVATVTQDGTVTAVAAGEATITVTTADGGKTATCKITVTDSSTQTVSVTSITLDETTLNLEVEDTHAFTVTVKPDNATNADVTITTSDAAVVSVKGKTITAEAEGTATITVTAKDGSGVKATCEVTVKPRTSEKVSVTGVQINKETASVEEGKTVPLTASVLPANATNKNVSWESSDATIATVDDHGTVTGVKAGTATITVKTADGNFTKTCTVTVTAKTTTNPDPIETATIGLGSNGLALKKGETVEVELKLDANYVGKKLYIYAAGEYAELTVAGSSQAGSGVLVTYAAGLKVSVKYTGEEDDEDTVFVCPVIAIGETEVTAAKGANLFAVIADEITEITATVKGESDGTVGFSGKGMSGTELETETTVTAENGIAVIELINNGEASVNVTLNIAEAEKTNPEFNGTTLKLDTAAEFSAEGFDVAFFKITLKAGSYTLNFADCDVANVFVEMATALNAEGDGIDYDCEITAENGAFTLGEDATVYILLNANDFVSVSGKLTVSEAQAPAAEKMTAEEFKAAVQATVEATNYTVSIDWEGKAVPVFKFGENLMYVFTEGDAYYVYNPETKTVDAYGVLREGSDILLQMGSMPGVESYAALIDMFMYADQNGMVPSLKTLASISADEYETVEFDEKTGVYTYGGITLTFKDGKVATFAEEDGYFPEMTFASYGTTAVELPAGNKFENVVYSEYAYYDAENPEYSRRLTEFAKSVSYGLYAQSNTKDNYVVATDKGYAQKIKENQNINISFAGLKGDIEGYFELSADAFGSKWDIIQFVGKDGAKKFCVNVTGNDGTLKYNTGADNAADKQTAPVNAVSMAANKKITVAYKIVKDGENYKLTLKINGKDFVSAEGFDLGTTAIDNITLVSSSGGTRKLTIDNVIICGTKMSVDEFRKEVQDKIDNMYVKMVGKEAEGETPAIVGTHTKAADTIKEEYDKINLKNATSFDSIVNEVYGFLNMYVDSDKDIEAAAAKAQKLIDALNTEEIAAKYTQESNQQRYNEFIQRAEQILTDAISVGQIESYFFDKKDIDGKEVVIFDYEFAQIPTDEQLAAQELAWAKEGALTALKENADAYIAELDLTEVAEANLDSVKATITEAWATAVAAVESAKTPSAVDTAMNTFNSEVNNAILNGSDNIDNKRQAAANGLQTATDKKIAQSGIAFRESALVEVNNAVAEQQAVIMQTHYGSEDELNAAVTAATLAIDRAYAMVALQEALYNAQHEASYAAVGTKVVNNKSLYEIVTTSNGNVSEDVSAAEIYVANAISKLDSVDTNTFNQSVAEAENSAAIATLLDTELGKLSTALADVKKNIAEKIEEVQKLKFTITIEDVTGITAEKVALGGKVVLAGSEPDDVLINGWYTDKSNGQYVNEYDFEAEVYNNVTLYADTVEAVKLNADGTFDWKKITGVADTAKLTNDNFTDTNAFIKVKDAETVEYRTATDGGTSSKKVNIVQISGNALQFVFNGKGSLEITLRGTESDKHAAMSLRKVTTVEGAETYATVGCKATYGTQTDTTVTEYDNNVYDVVSKDHFKIKFTVAEAGTYVLSTNTSVTKNGEAVSGTFGGARISGIVKLDSWKEEKVAVEEVEIKVGEEVKVSDTLNTEDKTTLQLTANVIPANENNKNVTWSSDNEAVATVDENGLVTAVAQGLAVITVTTADGNKTSTITIDVNGFATAVETKYNTIHAMEVNENWSAEDKEAFNTLKPEALSAIMGCTTGTALETTYRSYYNQLSAIGKTKYTVTYVYIKTDGTQDIVSEPIAEGSVLNGAMPGTSGERVGYDLVGWYTLGAEDAHVPFTFGETAIVNSDLTIYADYQIKTFAVTFNANGGTFANGDETATATVDYDTAAEPSDTPTNGNMSFDGWYYTEDGKEVKYEGAGITKPMTLTAKWAKPTITRTLDLADTNLTKDSDVSGGSQLEKGFFICQNGEVTIGETAIKNGPTYLALNVTGSIAVNKPSGASEYNVRRGIGINCKAGKVTVTVTFFATGARSAIIGYQDGNSWKELAKSDSLVKDELHTVTLSGELKADGNLFIGASGSTFITKIVVVSVDPDAE